MLVLTDCKRKFCGYRKRKFVKRLPFLPTDNSSNAKHIGGGLKAEKFEQSKASYMSRKSYRTSQNPIES